MTAHTDIIRILNEGYGDMQMGPLDRTVASRIINYLINAGWADPESVSLMVEAAGGEIIIHEDLITSDRKPLLRFNRPTDKAFILRTTKDEDVSSSSDS